MQNSIKERLKRNGYIPRHIFDIGACHGNWTKEVLSIYPDSKYYLFEPINYTELYEFQNRNNIQVNNILLYDKVETVNWYERRDTGDSIFKEISHHYSNVEAIEKQTSILNDYITNDMNQILVKIDCQGSEIPILKGASNFYDKIDFIILEIPFFGEYNDHVVNFIEHINFMDKIGFRVFDFVESHSINNFSMQVDIMFINKNHHFNELVKNRLQIKNYNIDNSKTVAFLSNKLTLRGTEVAIYDYADYNEKILGNNSIIITRDYEKISHEYDVDKMAYDKFHKRFPVFYYSSRDDIDNIVLNNNVSHIFIEKAGRLDDGLYSKCCKNIIHCVFTVDQPHGDVYTPLGQCINNIFGTNYSVFPYMVTLPECSDNLREVLNIPNDAIVFGRYGGKEAFDIRFVHDVIKKVTDNNEKIYFLFMNTNKFYEHKNIIYLQETLI